MTQQAELETIEYFSSDSEISKAQEILRQHGIESVSHLASFSTSKLQNPIATYRSGVNYQLMVDQGDVLRARETLGQKEVREEIIRVAQKSEKPAIKLFRYMLFAAIIGFSIYKLYANY